MLEKSKDKKKLQVPRTASRKTLRDVVHTSIEECYRGSICLSLLESLLQQLNNCFQRKTKDAIKEMYLLPSNNEKLVSEKEKIKAYYATDLSTMKNL